VATACTYCGQDLLRDDAHFCNTCGMLVPSHPFSSQSLLASSSATTPVQQEQEKPVTREQMVNQPAEKPVLREQMVQQPRSRTTRRIAPDNLFASPVAWPAPITHVSVKETSAQKDEERVEQKEYQRTHNVSLPQPAAPSERELRVKVWKQEHTNPPTPLPESDIEVAKSNVEDAPTSPIVVPEQTKIGNAPLQMDIDNSQNDVEHLDTAPMPNYAQEKRVPIAASATAMASRRQKSRIPFIILLAFMGVLVLGIGAWVALAQPFNIPAVTQPLQDFKDTRLGVALSYPNSWSVQRDPTGVLFSDSSHTAQVRLVVANDTNDTAGYVQQQATKNGMSAKKLLGTRSFAGASWLQIQGNMQQGGANYTTTMLATVHGNHMYMLTQMAPQNVYTDEDRVVFSAMRNSFQFLV